MAKDKKMEIKHEEEEVLQEVEETTGEPSENNSEADNQDAAAQPDNSLNEALEKKENENKELLDRIQRLAAEFDNYRKRTQKEKERLFIDATAEVVGKFLPVVDNLERALKAAESDEGQGLKDGVTLVFRQISDILAKLDVKPIETVGKTFNPEFHNAVMHIEDESLGHSEIVEEFQKGYTYKDEIVIRHSMVKVAN
ncbi:MAG: nucleotide exchange factor GrpE [Clostridia bacterium]|nr:nucleotide exchange factor GrpE [Clostridia bacterium]